MRRLPAILLAAAVPAASMAQAPTPAAPPEPPKCTASESRQFDFWIGEWNVTDQQTGQHAGESHIEKLYGGCVLRENWSSDGFRGGSLNTWWKGDGKWHQTWMDQAGAFRHFIGGLESGKMVMVARQPSQREPGKTVLVRLTFTPNADGTVRQFSDFSTDEGKNWQFRYDYLYRRMQ
jgi:hypothetical protein